MAPPQLPADRPIALFAEPIEIAFGIARGNDLHPAVGHGVHRRLGQILHPHEPLIGQVRLDRRLRAVGMGQLDLAIFDLRRPGPSASRSATTRCAGLENDQARVRAGVVVQRAVGIEDVDHRQLAAAADFVVVRIVGRRDLDAAASPARAWPIRRPPAESRGSTSGSRTLRPARAMSRSLIERRAAAFGGARAMSASCASMSARSFRGRGDSFSFSSRFDAVQCGGRIGMHGHGRVAQHRFGPRGGDRDELGLARLRVDHRIAEMPEVAGRRFRETLRRR